MAQTPVVVLSDMPETVMRNQMRQADMIRQKPSRWVDFTSLVKEIAGLART